MKDTLPTRVRLGVIEVDLQVGELRDGERTVLLQDQPFRILQMLIERGGELVTREEIKKRFWPNDTVVEFDHSINAALSKLRRAFDDSADDPRYIETIPRRGYRLMVPVERVVCGEASAAAAIAQVVDSPDVALAKSPDSGALSGRTVSHYRVLDIIGGGGMGVVYRAEDLKLGRRVALKFLPEEMSTEPQALERFGREARAVSSLDHPNICTIHEFGEHEGRPFLVMQLLEGETLRDRLAASEGPLPLEELQDLAIQISDGLQAAHERGIIHRDIKPANIFLTNKGVCKILDFGVAKLLEEAPGLSPANLDDEMMEAPAFMPANGDERERGLQPARGLHLTRTGSAMGTAGYMSPEQVRGEKLDAGTDIFSFGLVLYEMATGQRAFGGDTAAIVHDAILNRNPVRVHERNSTIPPKLEEIINRAIEKDRELRYQTAAEMHFDLQAVMAESGSGDRRMSGARTLWKWLAVLAVICVAMVAGDLFWHYHRSPKLTEKDTIVLADFDNETGDTIFDDTLKQGLSVQLEQSPFLNILSDRNVGGILKLMNRPRGQRLTEDVTREMCQRSGSKAMVTSSITSVGSQYVIGLKAVDCNMSDVLAEVQEQAVNKEAVLKTLGKAAINLRSKLGESLSSVEKYTTPLEEATTPSLEALKAYSMGRKTQAQGSTTALPFYERAVELDPNFAMPYVSISHIYTNHNEVGRASEYARKAYELREKVSERERFAIEANYYLIATGELEKAAKSYKLWQKTYPRDYIPYVSLGFIYATLGDPQKAFEENREAMRLGPNSETNYLNFGDSYVALNRLDEAEAVFNQAEERKLGSESLLGHRYALAFLRGDKVGMKQLAAGAQAEDDLLLAWEADTEGWYGKLKSARELTGRAMGLAERNDAREAAGAYQAAAALREVEFGNRDQASAAAERAVNLAPNRDVRALAALTLARADHTAEAEKLADELDNEFPLDTLVQRYWLPTIRAAVALHRKDPNQAVERLAVASTVELGQTTHVIVFLCPVYLRGEAYLMLHNGKAAATEFQKFIEHYGLVGNFPWGALARLGLARAYALEAQTDPAARDKARTAYQSFLTLWKDADPDIPIYKQAKEEYAKLQ